MESSYIGVRELNLTHPFRSLFPSGRVNIHACRTDYEGFPRRLGDPVAWVEKDWVIQQGGIPIEIYIEEANCGGYIP